MRVRHTRPPDKQPAGFVCICSRLLSLRVRHIHKSAWLLTLLSAVLQILIFPLPDAYLLSWIAITPLLVALLQGPPAEHSAIAGQRKTAPRDAMAGVPFGLYLRHPLVCRYMLLDIQHHAAIRRGQRAHGCHHPDPFLPLSGVVSRAFRLANRLAGAARLCSHSSCSAPLSRRVGSRRVSPYPRHRISLGPPRDQSGGEHSPRPNPTVTGVYGASFEIMVVNAALAAAFLLRREQRKHLLIAAIGAAVVLQSGRWLPVPALPTDRTALLVQQNIPILEGTDWTKDYLDGTLRDLTWISLHPAVPPGTTQPPHPDLIVWPESPSPFYTSDPVLRRTLSDLARQSQNWVLAGSIGILNANQSPDQATRMFNSASLVSPQGDWVARYDKMHLVPFGEYVPLKRIFAFASGLTAQVGDFTSGESREPLAANGTKLGVFICYESIFPDEIRQLARKGAGVFVNISNDGWYGDSGAYAQHLKQVRMRAVENARWILRDTNTGVTASIDPYGTNCGDGSTKNSHRARSALRFGQRYHLLYPLRGLVCLSVCDNFCGLALPIR